MQGIGSGQSRVRAAKVRVAKGWGSKCLGGQRAERESFVLRTYIVGRTGVKKLHLH